MQSVFLAITAFFLVVGISGGVFFVFLIVRCCYHEDEMSAFISALDSAPFKGRRRR